MFPSILQFLYFIDHLILFTLRNLAMACHPTTMTTMTVTVTATEEKPRKESTFVHQGTLTLSLTLTVEEEEPTVSTCWDYPKPSSPFWDCGDKVPLHFLPSSPPPSPLLDFPVPSMCDAQPASIWWKPTTLMPPVSPTSILDTCNNMFDLLVHDNSMPQ